MGVGARTRKLNGGFAPTGCLGPVCAKPNEQAGVLLTHAVMGVHGNYTETHGNYNGRTEKVI